MLSLCMIVKNEEYTIEKCLKKAILLANDIVIVDTGSTDKTRDIAMKYTDKVFDFKWCNDFSKVRNYSIEKSNNDWILVLDADEVITDFNEESIKNFCNEMNRDKVGRIKIINIYEDEYGIRKYTERVNRLFNKRYFEYNGIIHEQIVSKEKNIYSTRDIKITLNHIGYSKEVIERSNKVERNIILLEEAIEKNFTDPYLHYQLGKSYFMGKEFKKACISFEKSLQLIDGFEYKYSEDLVETYGYTLLKLKLFNKALNLYKYEKYYNKHADYLFILGLIEMNLGNFTKSVELFDKCTKCGRGKIDGINCFLPLYNIGVILECLGLKQEAVDYYRMCNGYSLADQRIKLILRK